MRILLDECVPRRLKDSLPDHECHTVPDAGLAGKKNEIFVTMDKGLQYQQNL
jgi:predicted nuclease of predicted toxin-antitoxin system